ncbi:hypothetical protein I3760_08G172300 [Carya illinoinensis]|uniref:Uncharacterized protein n=1 Tax=Carya illinoinensis TaxID=32201 RepID=A0A922JBN1_CARIL|nr:hypothetical protein I3760_08G172300 [Carya illinoinensis]KAG6701675.1 hypothetical protein I3842_08G177100 [Carya illinoinensis]
MATLSRSFSPIQNPQTHLLSGPLKPPTDQCFLKVSSSDSSLGTTSCGKVKLETNKSGDVGRPNTASIFVGGFVLGGIVVGTLGCIYAPQLCSYLMHQLVLDGCSPDVPKSSPCANPEKRWLKLSDDTN